MPSTGFHGTTTYEGKTNVEPLIDVGDLPCPLTEQANFHKHGQRSRQDTQESNITTASAATERPLAQGVRVREYAQKLEVDLECMESLLKEFEEQRLRGLKNHLATVQGKPLQEGPALPMLDSFIPCIPSTTFESVVYAVDFGGSTLRIVRLEPCHNFKNAPTQRVVPIGGYDKYADLKSPNTPGAVLFEFIADQLRDVLSDNGDLSREIKEKIRVGFTFSFPSNLESLKRATLTTWVKEWETGRETSDKVENENVIDKLQAAVDKIKLPVDVVAATNDTVGCLISCQYTKSPTKPRCRVGIIIGTGVNGCYCEPQASSYGYVSEVINTELAAFELEIARIDIDENIDRTSGNPGKQLFEKCCSGRYLGEIVRLLVIAVFGSRAPALAEIPDTFSAADAAACAFDTSDDMSNVTKVIRKQWEEELCLDDLKDIRDLALAVVMRSAALAAVAIAGCVLATSALDAEGVTVGIDGSLYLKNVGYAALVYSRLTEMLKEKVHKLHIVESSDGSGRGAALIASMC